MKITDRTREILHYKREVRRLERLSYKQAAEPFWQLSRGGLQGHEIIEVVIGPDKNKPLVQIG